MYVTAWTPTRSKTQDYFHSYQVKNPRLLPVSGPDLFQSSLMQDFEQNQIGLVEQETNPIPHQTHLSLGT